jgi:hypothetical protein
MMLAADSSRYLTDLRRKLSGAGFIHETRQRFAKMGALAGNARTYKKTEYGEGKQKKQINNCDCPDSPMDKFLQSPDRWIDEIRKNDGEEEKDQGSPGGVQKAYP